MKRLLVLIPLFLVGCANISGTRTDSQGNTLKIASQRWFWKTEGLDATVTDANGFTFNLKAAVDSPDAQSIKAAFDGSSQLLGAAAKAGLLAGNTGTGTNSPVVKTNSAKASLEIEPPPFAQK